jgi:hypothetical protein
MSSMYAEIVQTTRKIIDIVGPCSKAGRKLALSGNLPHMPDVTLQDLLSTSAYMRLQAPVRSQVSEIIRATLMPLRDRSLQRYRTVAAQLHSVEESGMPDSEMEMSLIHMYEVRYQKTIDSLRRMLARLLDTPSSAPDNRNTRGGFGDVSPPLPLKANIQQTLRILEAAFNHTKSPLSTEIDHLSKLTSLEPHQVRPHYPYPFIELIHRCALGYVHFLFFAFITYSILFPLFSSLNPSRWSRQ